MVPLWESLPVASTTFLVCLFVTGCSHSRGFNDGTAEITNPTSNVFASPAEPTQLTEKRESTAVDVVSSWFPVEQFHGDCILLQSTTMLPAEKSPTPDADSFPIAPVNTPQAVWGILDVRGFPVGQAVAANGVEFNQIFSLGLDFNIMLWPDRHLYLFSESSFLAQKATPGITNANQGSFDFSKREFDFNAGVAWNYTGSWEARVFGYSFNNLNRGNSNVSPSGFNDGTGLENRFYFGHTYADLGTVAFDQARATFFSVGYYPTRSMVDAYGNEFRPGPFVRAYLTCDLWGEQYYLYGDVQFISTRAFLPTLLNWDAGLAARPFTAVPKLEFRVGTQDMLDLQGGDLEPSAYLAVRYIY